MTILEMLLTGFVIGFTGAMAPGPMLFATIESSLETGWTAGPKIFLGHAALEALISALIIFGIGALVNDSAVRGDLINRWYLTVRIRRIHAHEPGKSQPECKG